MASKKIVLGITGSIAAYKSCELASLLTKEARSVNVVMTSGAREFVSALTFKSLTGNPVFYNIFQGATTHISLGGEADLIVVAPATASFISELACGLASDPVSLTVISSSAPVLICPAMNETMFHNQMVQDNIEKLKGIGYFFLGPYKGWLSCGYEGEGRLADVADIAARINIMLK